MTCDAAPAGASLDSVDALCRLALVARRAGCELRLRNVDAGLRELLVLCGVARAVGLAGAPRRGDD